MALTAAQLADVRRFCGYAVAGDLAYQAYREMAYSDVSYASLSLETRLANLAPEEEAILTGNYLPALQTMELAIDGTGSNLDTDRAAVWTHNANELTDRTALFNQKRLQLCAFLGFPPGSGLTAMNCLVRC